MTILSRLRSCRRTQRFWVRIWARWYILTAEESFITTATKWILGFNFSLTGLWCWLWNPKVYTNNIKQSRLANLKFNQPSHKMCHLRMFRITSWIKCKLTFYWQRINYAGCINPLFQYFLCQSSLAFACLLHFYMKR